MIALLKALFAEGPVPANTQIEADQEIEDLSEGFIHTLGLEGQDIHPGLDR